MRQIPFKKQLVGYYHKATEEWPETFYSLSETNGGPDLYAMYIYVLDKDSYDEWFDENTTPWIKDA